MYVQHSLQPVNVASFAWNLAHNLGQLAENYEENVTNKCLFYSFGLGKNLSNCTNLSIIFKLIAFDFYKLDGNEDLRLAEVSV